MSPLHVGLACLAIGLGLGWSVCDFFWRKRQRILSNWEPGMIITTSDNERLYVCAVEAWQRHSASEEKKR